MPALSSEVLRLCLRMHSSPIATHRVRITPATHPPGCPLCRLCHRRHQALHSEQEVLDGDAGGCSAHRGAAASGLVPACRIGIPTAGAPHNLSTCAPPHCAFCLCAGGEGCHQERHHFPGWSRADQPHHGEAPTWCACLPMCCCIGASAQLPYTCMHMLEQRPAP